MIWKVDAVLDERLSRALAPHGLSTRIWLQQILLLDASSSVGTVHYSTMGRDPSNNFEEIDEPCGVRIPLRVSIDRDERIVHVREMPLGTNLVYANYQWIDDDHDEERLWSSPILFVDGMDAPDTLCAAISGLRLGDVVSTRLDALDDLTIDWAAREPGDVARRIRHGGIFAGDHPAALIIRLAQTALLEMEP